MKTLLFAAVLAANVAAQEAAIPTGPSPMVLESKAVVFACPGTVREGAICVNVQNNRYAFRAEGHYSVGAELTVGFTVLDDGDGNLRILDIRDVD